MKVMLLCSHDPILIKSLYGIVRDEGFLVEVVDHPAFAVQMILKNTYHAVIFDAQPFGLSVEDATRIIKTISPDTKIILLGYPVQVSDALSIDAPLDLEEFKQAFHDIKGFQHRN